LNVLLLKFREKNSFKKRFKVGAFLNIQQGITSSGLKYFPCISLSVEIEPRFPKA
jgi:hypothetical protein